MFFYIVSFVGPFMVNMFPNLSVFKLAKRQINAIDIHIGNLVDAKKPAAKYISRRIRERKAAVDVCVIIAAFSLCFFPGWIVGQYRT